MSDDVEGSARIVKTSTEFGEEGPVSQDTSNTPVSGAERPRSGQSVANPRRLRLGRDGRPLPVMPRDEDSRPA